MHQVACRKPILLLILLWFQLSYHQLLVKLVLPATIEAPRRSACPVLWGSGLRQERLYASAVPLVLIPVTTCRAQTASPVNIPKQTGESVSFAVWEQFPRRKRASALCARLTPMLTIKTTNASLVKRAFLRTQGLITASLFSR
jgi:hypothetical protein